jgi:GT2 family glycosyltransferase
MKYLLLVPCYNAAHLLPFFFQSLKNMNPKPDYIVWSVNNCTDNTVQMLRDFSDIPSEIIELPDFPRDFAKTHGEYAAMATVRQCLWERARQLNADWTLMCDQDEFAVTIDILDILSGWNVDYVGARVLSYSDKEENYKVGASWHNSKSKGSHYGLCHEIEIIPNELIVARPAEISSSFLDPSPIWVWGFCCFSRRLVQDRHLYFHPILKGYGEDVGFCVRARRLGYQPYLDGIVIVDHVVYDAKNTVKAWAGEVVAGLKNFEFGESKSQ